MDPMVALENCGRLSIVRKGWVVGRDIPEALGLSSAPVPKTERQFLSVSDHNFFCTILFLDAIDTNVYVHVDNPCIVTSCTHAVFEKHVVIRGYVHYEPYFHTSM